MSDRYIIEKSMIVSDTGSLDLAYDRLKNCRVVVKSINVDNTGFASKLLEELISLYSLRPYPYFCNILDHYIVATGNAVHSINIVTKYYPKGNLCLELLRRGENNDFYSEDELLKNVSSLLSGCSIMQKLGISHRDLKPDNILIDDENNLIISDLGASCLINNSSTIRGSPSYLSPEMRKRLKCQLSNSMLEEFEDFDLSKSDVWSLGVTFLFMITLKPQTDFQSIVDYQSKIREKLIKIQVEVLRELISQMLVFDPNDRKDFVYLNNWFNQKTRNRFEDRNSLVKILGRTSVLDNYSNPLPVSTSQPVLEISSDSPSIKIQPSKPASTKFQRKSIGRPPGPSCEICNIRQEFHICSNCSFTIHTPCLGNSFESCPKCGKSIPSKDFLITCASCLKTFQRDQVKSCLHNLCPSCQLYEFNCGKCLGFNIYSMEKGDTSLIGSFPCGQCDALMKIKGKVIFCQEHKAENCIGCKRRPHQDSCFQYDNRASIPCLRCDANIYKPDPSIFKYCQSCALTYCYVCSKEVNEVSHLNCARIYSSFN